MYTKYPVWIFAQREDAGKEAGEVPADQRMLIEVGSKVTAGESISVETGDDTEQWTRIELPDGSAYWLAQQHLVEHFVVITRSDVLCYDQPDTTFATTIFLQPGDFGYHLDEQEGWIKANFYAYRPREPEGEPQWVGRKWIKSNGFTDDIMAAKEAYYLFRARRDLRQGRQSQAVEHLERALQINPLADTQITPVIRERLNEVTDSDEVY
jgi:hypothetical protein